MEHVMCDDRRRKIFKEFAQTYPEYLTGYTISKKLGINASFVMKRIAEGVDDGFLEYKLDAKTKQLLHDLNIDPKKKEARSTDLGHALFNEHLTLFC